MNWISEGCWECWLTSEDGHVIALTLPGNELVGLGLEASRLSSDENNNTGEEVRFFFFF
jgi:hypothetical protein